MKDSVVALVSTLGGLIIAGLVLVILPTADFFLNYRDAQTGEWIMLWMVTAFVVYLLCVYGVAVLLRQRYASWTYSFEPSLVSLGSAVGGLIGLALLIPLLRLGASSYFLRWLPALVSFIPVLLMARLACLIKYRKGAGRRGTLLRILIPVLLGLTLTAINYTGFPGSRASAETRQQWAYKEFEEYPSVVEQVSSCKLIIDRVGAVKTVAPIKGRNTINRDPGSSGHRGELTLEVVGEAGTGVANSSFHIFTSLYEIKFTQNNKTETLTCP
ncbi:MAG: hypothetical protein WA949_19260 [Phormidesmis sp.]